MKPILDLRPCAETGCTYSRAIDQPYPRKCTVCGHPEPMKRPSTKHVAVSNQNKPIVGMLLHKDKVLVATSDAVYELRDDVLMPIVTQEDFRLADETYAKDKG